MNRPLRLAGCSQPISWWTWVYCGVFCGVSWVGVTLLVNRSQRYCRPSAAVGADLSRPHIRKHPRNGGGKCVFDEMNAGIWRIGYVYLVMWKHIFDDARIRARRIGPYAWRSVRNQFRGCSHAFVKCLQRVGYLYITFSQNKRVVFALQKYGFWRAKRGFLMDKNRVLHF